MKQLERVKKEIGDNAFYIRPFPAFKAANLSGELFSTLVPIIGGLLPAFTGSAENITDQEVEAVMPAFSSAMSTLSGDKIESLMKKLLINEENISVEGDDSLELLTMDTANELFCGDVQDMYILCFYVIQINFKGFFKRLKDQFGDRIEALQEKATTFLSTGAST